MAQIDRVACRAAEGEFLAEEGTIDTGGVYPEFAETADEIRVDLAQDADDDRECGIVSIAAAGDLLRGESRFRHRAVDRLAPAVNEHDRHAEAVQGGDGAEAGVGGDG